MATEPAATLGRMGPAVGAVTQGIYPDGGLCRKC